MSDHAYLHLIDRLGIVVETHEHPPVLTVSDAQAHWTAIDATHTKNLLLKDEGRQLWLVVLAADATLDLKSLPAAIGSRRLRFASTEDLAGVLGVETGGLSPLALVNDTDNKVRLAIAKPLLAADRLGFHPLRNTATVSLSPIEVRRYLAATGHSPIIF